MSSEKVIFKYIGETQIMSASSSNMCTNNHQNLKKYVRFVQLSESRDSFPNLKFVERLPRLYLAGRKIVFDAVRTTAVGGRLMYE